MTEAAFRTASSVKEDLEKIDGSAEGAGECKDEGEEEEPRENDAPLDVGWIEIFNLWMLAFARKKEAATTRIYFLGSAEKI